MAKNIVMRHIFQVTTNPNLNLIGYINFALAVKGVRGLGSENIGMSEISLIDIFDDMSTV